ncbi:hypothetical protein ACFRAO_21530 [Streptomyces sp. NPDC056656]|uniref:hypothetical protein n=1 Tax=Streptomyces sp. NPDC056656 TaxID=3345895 RepID=UPI0036D16259
MGFTEKTRPAPEPGVGHERTSAEWVGPAALAVLPQLTGAFAGVLGPLSGTRHVFWRQVAERRLAG